MIGLTFQALTWKGIPPRRVCPGPGWPLGPRGRESAPQLPEAEPCQSNQYLIYLKVSCNRCPFKCPPFHCEQPRQRKEEEGRGKNGLGAFFPTKWSSPLLQRCFDNFVLTQIQIQNLLTAFSFPSNLQPKMKSASSPYYFSSQIKMFNRQSLLTQVCPRKVSAAARAQVGGHLLNLCRRSIPPTLR